MADEQLLRPRDVAHILDCCPDDLYPLIYAGEIKAEKVGRLWKFRMEDVMDYKRSGERENRTHGTIRKGEFEEARESRLSRACRFLSRRAISPDSSSTLFRSSSTTSAGALSTKFWFASFFLLASSCFSSFFFWVSSRALSFSGSRTSPRKISMSPMT